MIDRKIKVVEKDSFYWTVDIDGHIIKLSRHLKKQQGGLDLGNEENIRYLLKIIEDSFIWRQTFRDVRNLISGANLLIILDTLYPESTLELFGFLYRKQLEISYISFRKFFYSVFLVYHDTHYISKTGLPSKLSCIAKTIAFQQRHPKEFCQVASNATFCVNYISTTNNIATSFIKETQGMRNKLDNPYLLVYYPINWRTDTHRKPCVVSADTISYYMSKLLADTHIETLDGLPEKASLRSIRAEIGRSLFAEGKSAQEVSEYLGNSPMVAQTHYDNYLPIDDAKMYDALWQDTIEKGIDSCSKTKSAPHSVMYGTCVSQKECSGKDCRKCPSLIQCKGGDTDAFRCPSVS